MAADRHDHILPIHKAFAFFQAHVDVDVKPCNLWPYKLTGLQKARTIGWPEIMSSRHTLEAIFKLTEGRQLRHQDFVKQLWQWLEDTTKMDQAHAISKERQLRQEGSWLRQLKMESPWTEDKAGEACTRIKAMMAHLRDFRRIQFLCPTMKPPKKYESLESLLRLTWHDPEEPLESYDGQLTWHELFNDGHPTLDAVDFVESDDDSELEFIGLNDEGMKVFAPRRLEVNETPQKNSLSHLDHLETSKPCSAPESSATGLAGYLDLQVAMAKAKTEGKEKAKAKAKAKATEKRQAIAKAKAWEREVAKSKGNVQTREDWQMQKAMATALVAVGRPPTALNDQAPWMRRLLTNTSVYAQVALKKKAKGEEEGNEEEEEGKGEEEEGKGNEEEEGKGEEEEEGKGSKEKAMKAMKKEKKAKVMKTKKAKEEGKGKGKAKGGGKGKVNEEGKGKGKRKGNENEEGKGKGKGNEKVVEYIAPGESQAVPDELTPVKKLLKRPHQDTMTEAERKALASRSSEKMAAAFLAAYGA
jgi:hypothetical protein